MQVHEYDAIYQYVYNVNIGWQSYIKHLKKQKPAFEKLYFTNLSLLCIFV